MTMADGLIEELPALAIRIKQFVRSVPPLEDGGFYDSDEELRKHAVGRFSSELLIKAAEASRMPLSFPIENTDLTLADLRGYENAVNSEPLATLPRSGVGLFRVVRFDMSRGHRNQPVLYVNVEYSPLGWPELPDTVARDLNTLFKVPDATATEQALRDPRPHTPLSKD